MTHELKILPRWFNDVAEGKKKFEIRKADRDFKEDKWIILKEWENGEYTGRCIEAIIEYIYYGDGTYGLPEGWCILGIKVMSIYTLRYDRNQYEQEGQR